MSFKKILNKSEEATNRRVKEICDNRGAIVYPKVRLADILPIESSGISNELYRFSLQAHFDFTVTDTQHTPLFAVEYDGSSHFHEKQHDRDNKKNELCEHFHFPLLRIDAGYLDRKYRNLDILGWFIEAWFFSVAFYNAQEKGIIPPDEPFVPFTVCNLPGYKETFPLWLALPIQLKIRKLYEAKIIKDFCPSFIIGEDKKGNYYGIIWIHINNEKGVIANVTIKEQLFPIPGVDILDELLIYRIYEELSKTLSGKIPALEIEEIIKNIKKFEEEYEVHIVSGTSSPSG